MLLERRTNGDLVDLAFNRETQRAQLGQPRVTILIVDECEDADHPRVKVASNGGPSLVIAPVDHISSPDQCSIHTLRMEQAGRGDPNLNLTSHIDGTLSLT